MHNSLRKLFTVQKWFLDMKLVFFIIELMRSLDKSLVTTTHAASLRSNSRKWNIIYLIIKINFIFWMRKGTFITIVIINCNLSWMRSPKKCHQCPPEDSHNFVITWFHRNFCIIRKMQNQGIFYNSW